MNARCRTLLVTAAATALGVWHGAALPERDDDSADRPLYLQVVTQQGRADFRLLSTCPRGRVHRWGRSDATGRIRQWLDGAAQRAAYRLCLRLDGRVREVRITPLGGHCGEAFGRVEPPDEGAVLRRPRVITARVSGCHATLADTRFGGIALRFADGFGVGDSYVAGVFYGAYDAFGRGRLAPVGVALFRIADFNTHHFRVEIRDRRGRPWRPGTTHEPDRGGR